MELDKGCLAGDRVQHGGPALEVGHRAHPGTRATVEAATVFFDPKRPQRREGCGIWYVVYSI